MIKFTIALTSLMLTLIGCSPSGNYNSEVCESIMKSEFESAWIDSFTPAKKMEPDTCVMIVVTRAVINGEDHDALFKNELTAKYKYFEDGQFSYTHEVNSLGIEQVPIRNLSKKELLQIAEELDVKYGDQDICTGYLKALLNNESTGTGQQMCAKPPQFRNY